MDNVAGNYREAETYEFLTELKPGVWKICSRRDRTEYLAHDVTDMLYTQGAETALQQLLNKEPNAALTLQLGDILNHENLVSLIDWLRIDKTPFGGRFRERQYTVWDYCDAGNLGNLFVLQSPSRGPRRFYPEDEDAKKEPDLGGDGIDWRDDPDDPDDDDALEVAPVDKVVFLPESLCWHVLISILKALAWLHDGSRSFRRTEDGKGWDMHPKDPDWLTMLHRDIHPNNIFFSHPKRNEWYGTCRLGNYGSLSISNHNHGKKGEVRPEIILSKPLAPARGKNFQTIEDLIRSDYKYSYTYPQQADQPYTVVSEWRAFGEIMQAMMIRPATNRHLESIPTRTVRENLERADYSDLLKNLVVKLMTLNPDERLPDGDFRTPDREYMTSRLCAEAWAGFLEWRRSDRPEARGMVFVWDAVADQAREDVLRLQWGEVATEAARRIPRRQDKLFGDNYVDAFGPFGEQSPAPAS
ncbi:hypothetical protein GGS23DRAFT_594347 [Durotheca rogersii]|uniref:uncharacterized protein n=1 Tax=Durotheca rogersii TaxID=419775 RepID=UPI0022201EE1|nr:uncharacterized protein GGS23DRAFT_594347 [Durotheca rogersii]KAI5866206.1 hypothetical protein GGS23DRAFT_594347 [Durotheca rogersii]